MFVRAISQRLTLYTAYNTTSYTLHCTLHSLSLSQAAERAELHLGAADARVRPVGGLVRAPHHAALLRRALPRGRAQHDLRGRARQSHLPPRHDRPRLQVRGAAVIF